MATATSSDRTTRAPVLRDGRRSFVQRLRSGDEIAYVHHVLAAR